MTEDRFSCSWVCVETRAPASFPDTLIPTSHPALEDGGIPWCPGQAYSPWLMTKSRERPDAGCAPLATTGCKPAGGSQSPHPRPVSNSSQEKQEGGARFQPRAGQSSLASTWLLTCRNTLKRGPKLPGPETRPWPWAERVAPAGHTLQAHTRNASLFTKLEGGAWRVGTSPQVSSPHRSPLLGARPSRPVPPRSPVPGHAHPSGPEPRTASCSCAHVPASC